MWLRGAAFLLLLSLTEAAKGGKNRIRGVKWWNLAYTASLDNTIGNPSSPIYINPDLQDLTRKQRRLVTKNPGTIVAIAKGARMAIDECQYQFQHRRWNCPTNEDGNGGSVFGKILRKGCRETSFIYGITSAAVVHSVARACSEGSVYTCTCGRRVERPPQSNGRDWEWGGCSDNAEFGHKFSRDFVDVVEKGRDLRYLMNLHNNEAGRMHVSTNMRQECKCHGMSGSCTIETCWMRLPTFRQVSDHLKDRFDGASKVYQANSGNSVRNRVGRYNLLPVDPDHKPPGPFDIVYFDDSPKFCDEDKSVGFQGTKGRECNATSIGVDGCDLMCCGRGYRTETYTARERCRCVFHWCCKVTCEICIRQKVRNLCT